jgi:hypothetical protein
MKKLGLICLAVMLALGSLGVAYAAWTDMIFIEGSVDTGTLVLGINDCDVRDDDAPINFGGDFPTDDPDQSILPGFVGSPFYLDKNVAWGDCWSEDTDGDGVNDKTHFTIHNGYPCYFNEFAFYPYNAGTIPLRIDSVLIDWGYGSQLITSSPTYVGMDINGDGCDDVEILWGDNFGTQLEPDSFSVEVSFLIHVLQCAPQNAELSFTATMLGVQWDEYPYTPPTTTPPTTTVTPT